MIRRLKNKEDYLVIFSILLLTLFSIVQYGSVTQVFDENHYYRVAKLIGEYIRLWIVEGKSINFKHIEDWLVGLGYFTPGMVYINVPFHVTFGDVSLYYNRIYMAIINLCIYLLIYKELTKLAKLKLWHKVLFVSPLMMPFFQFYFVSVYGDLIASLFSILIVIKMENKLKKNETISWPFFILLGFILGGLVLIRSQYILFPILIFGRMLFCLNVKLIFKCVVSILIMLAVISHWNSLLKERFGDVFMATSVYEKDFVYDENYSVNIAGASGINQWVTVHKYMLNSANERNVKLKEFIDSQKEFLQPFSFDRKIEMARISMERFFFNPDSLIIYINKSNKSIGSLIYKVQWYLLLLFFIITCAVMTKNKSYSFLNLILSGLFTILTVQSILYFSNERYHIATIPVMIAMIILSSVTKRDVCNNFYCETLYRIGTAFFNIYIMMLVSLGIYVYAI